MKATSHGEITEGELLKQIQAIYKTLSPEQIRNIMPNMYLLSLTEMLEYLKHKLRKD